MTKAILFLSLLLPSFAQAGGVCPREFADVIASTRKLIVMTGDGFDAVTGSLQILSRENTADTFTDETSTLADKRAVFGSKGMAWGHGFTALRSGAQPIKKEGDQRSPIGVFKIGVRFGFVATGRKEFLPLLPTTECVDDASSVHYSQIIDTRTVKKDWRSAEKMRAEPLYERGMNVLYNEGRVAGVGSCIFLHHWRDAAKGTAGCGAMNPKAMLRLHQWLGESTDAAVLMIPRAELERVRGCF